MKTPPFAFGTKSETLARLKPLLLQSRVLPMQFFSVECWQNAPTACLQQIASLECAQVVIRSSAQLEDGASDSMAGAFLSCLNVPADNLVLLKKSIDAVVASFSCAPNPRNQVLIQPMLTNIQMSGVVMTHDLQRGAPYYLINYDDESGQTDTITGGCGVEKSVMIYRESHLDAIRSPRLRTLMQACRELEGVCGGVPLDIEFAIDHQGQVYILQVRRISLYRQWHPVTERRVARQLEHVKHFLELHMGHSDGLYGKRSVLGDMPDWNPAEIIGANPRPLAVSLYRLLITDSVWREGRAAMGYHHPRHQPLMLLVGQHPFIDVRASFNSLLPAGLSAEVATLLVDSWIDRLVDNPQWHDKVEFDIVPTCFDFDFDQQFSSRYSGLLSAEQLVEYRTALLDLTKHLIGGRGLGSLGFSLAQIHCREQTQYARGRFAYARLESVRDLLLECREQGTFHFSIIARHAFVAESMLRSACRLNVLAHDRVALWKTSITTVSGQLTEEFQAVCDGSASTEAFLSRFGHLRPGTYDITSLRYDERSDLFIESGLTQSPVGNSEFCWQPRELAGMEALLAENSWGISAQDFFVYASSAIAGREYAKLVFTRDLSDALACLTLWGAENGLSRDDLSFLEIERLLALLICPMLDDLDRQLLNEVSHNKSRCEDASLIKLSHLILEPSEIFVAPIHRALANFIGQQCIEAPLLVLSAGVCASQSFCGKLVCIENADPGYDWIFTRGIAGLITKFGGANSHMAIRCAEFGIPAAIGCGEQLYGRLRTGAKGVLNCRDKSVTLL